MDKILLSSENAYSILKAYMTNIEKKIAAKDLAATHLDKLNLADKIKIDGKGSSFLFDNGKYIELDIDKLKLTKENINTIYKLFNINIVTQEEKWASIGSMIHPDQCIASSMCDNHIYIFGGYTYKTTTRCYDISTNTWTTKADLPYGTFYETACRYNTDIYVLGGNTGDYSTLSKNQKYDTITDTYTQAAEKPVNINVQFTSAILYESTIYNFGSSCKYDIKTNTWSSFTDMVGGAVTCELYKNKVYSTNVCYDINTDTWSQINNSSYNLTYNASCIYQNYIYILGGDGNSVSRTQCYDIITDTWSSKLNLLSARTNRPAAEVVGYNIYLFGFIESVDKYDIETSIEKYDLILPDSIQTKLDIIKQDGKGDKFLSDTGSYIDITPTFNIMQDSDINDLVSRL